MIQPFPFLIPHPTIYSVSCTKRTAAAKHANKSVGPTKWLEVHGQDAAGSSEYHSVKGRAIDFPVFIHQGRHHGDLEGGAEGVTKIFVADVRKIRQAFDGALVVGYDTRNLVTLIKDREQTGRTTAAGESGEKVFDRHSNTPILPSRFTSWLQENGKAARDARMNRSGNPETFKAHPMGG